MRNVRVLPRLLLGVLSLVLPLAYASGMQHVATFPLGNLFVGAEYTGNLFPVATSRVFVADSNLLFGSGGLLLNPQISSGTITLTAPAGHQIQVLQPPVSPGGQPRLFGQGPQVQVPVSAVTADPQGLAVQLQGPGVDPDDILTQGFMLRRADPQDSRFRELVRRAQEPDAGMSDSSTGRTGGGGGGGGGLVPCGKDKPCELKELVQVAVNIFNFLIKVGGAATVLAVVISGIRYFVAVFEGASSQAIGAAKTSLGYAILGTIILLTSYVVVNTVFRVLGGTGKLPGLQ